MQCSLIFSNLSGTYQALIHSNILTLTMHHNVQLCTMYKKLKKKEIHNDSINDLSQ